ncbi:hypothetical protein J6590_019287 [Homalodisca vitripennis]|nr:hypothetical protein J6590_019287 [Homalodisca vitripennis]
MSTGRVIKVFGAGYYSELRCVGVGAEVAACRGRKVEGGRSTQGGRRNSSARTFSASGQETIWHVAPGTTM